MKKLMFIPVIVLAALFTSCSDENEGSNGVSDSLSEEIDLDTDAALESNYEDVDAIVSYGMESIAEGGRVAQDEVLDCAVVTNDADNNILTIDYGDGCEGPGGRLRAGKIIIAYNDHRLIPGAFREISFEDFSVDGVLVEGTRRIENISEDLDDDPSFEVTLTGGMLTFEDGTTATRETNHTRTWIRASNPLNDTTEVEGTASGKRRDDISYNVEVTERLVYKRSCRARGVFIPVSGIKVITFEGNTAIIDYGDGECDNIVTITINDGEPFDKVISPRGRRF